MVMYFYITMEIRDIQGNILIDALVTQDAVKVDELMKQHSITLSWVAASNEQLPLGAHIDYEGVRYSLLEPYNPEQSDEATYNYKPEFQHPVMRWQYLPFFHYAGSNKELDWSLTDNPANFMSAVVKAINEQTGDYWGYDIASNIAASASLTFNNVDIFSALNSIASAFETEWWFDYGSRTIHLSKAEHGSAVTLEVGENISVPSKTQSKKGYYTRFYAFGSTRNIEQDYQGSNVNSIVNRRLTLDPQQYPEGYIDIREGLTGSEIKVKTLVFDDIYPRSSLTISQVRVRLMWRLDDDNQKIKIGTDIEGNPVYDQYAIWYFKIPGLEFNKDSIISGKPLSVHFNSGPLNGREFELTYHEEEKTVETSDGMDFIVEAGDYEINFIEEGTYIIPAITGLIPAEGDAITLFNIVMPEEYKASAYEELEEAVLKEIGKQSEDTGNYTFDSNKVAFYNSNPGLTIGRAVTFVNGSHRLSTRVIRLETKLDHPFEQRITVGNAQIKGTTQTLKEEVVSANENIDLIAAINKSTEAFIQSLQKTQKAVQNSLAKWATMWTYDKENDAARTTLNLIVEKSITFGGDPEGGDGEGSGSQVGITTFDVYVGTDGPYTFEGGKVNLPAYPTVPKSLPNPYALSVNGVRYDGSAPVEIEIKAGVDDTQLADYAKKEWVEQKGYLTELLAQSTYQPKGDYVTSADMESALKRKQDTITDLAAIRSGAALGATALQEHQDISHLLSKTEASETYQPLGDYALLDDLNSYLTKSSAKATYATIAALNAAIADHDALREEFDALNTLINANASEYIDTWNEVKNFLDGYSDSDDLATILAGINADIAKRAKQTDLNAAVTRIGTLESTLETEQSYIDTLQGYFTSGKANRAIADGNGNNIVDTYATKVALNSTNTDLTALSKEFSEFKELINSLWYLDPDHANTVRTKLNVVVEQAISFGGYGESDGSGNGGITTVTKDMVISALGYTPYNASNPSGYITASALSGYATQSWVTEQKYLTAVPSEYITETELTNKGYATKGTTLSHYGITDAYTKTQVDNKLVNYLTTNTAQTVLASGAKTFKGAYGENIYIGGTKSGVTIDINAASGGYARALSFINSASDVSGYVLFGAHGNSASGFQSAYIGVGEQDYNNAILNIYTDRIAVAGAASFSGLTTHSAGLKVGTTNVTEKTQNSIKYVEIDGNLVVTGAISFGGFGEGDSTGGGITSVTKDMVIDALGYTPYNAANFTKANIKSTLGIYDWALAANKPTYTKSDVGLGNVTNLAASGYLTDLSSNTTNAVSITVGGTTKNISSSTLKTSLGLGSLAYKSSLVASDIPNLSWSKITSGKPTTLSGYGITDALGINGTAADSNKLGGEAASAYAKFAGEIFNGDYKHIGYSYERNIGHTGPVIAFGASASYYAQIAAESGFLYFRQYYLDHWFSDGWNQLAFTTSNVASATKLKNSRTLWGQSFDGTSNVTGYLNSILNPIYPTSDVLAVNIEAVVATLNYAHIYVSNKTGSTNRPLVLQYGYGNVGIGVEQPSYKLDVQGATRISDSNGSGVVIANQGNTIDGYYNGISGNLYINNASAGNVYLVTGGGNVGIGTNSPSSKLHVAGDITLSDTTGSASKSYKLKFLRRTATDDYWDFGMYAQSTKGLTFYQSANSVDTDIAYLTGEGNFVVNGSITFGSASDRRLKDNIKSMTDKQAVAVLKALNPVTFKWNSTAYELGKLSGVSDGFIADEYEKLIPNSGRDIWANYRAINYERVSGYFVKGWQNHETRLERAESRIKELENELKQYRYGTV